ncbi:MULTISPECIES: LPS O-antigen length regulator Wzz(fepE) [Photorhabdus]|uniref:Ferric enterobactin transport protein n=2 Tax=Photorhabdus asymbiotica TaxID=291112 RepID=B6VNS2_PHOAA|nr:LPS O-antigen length regulator Wzz(fepE) [Photorhabdus asymbiotica]RKS59333.1 LPS O-antigen subunit length determinant protein (WzzB/FepE family) [Photorhabdus asymbiotica]CAQ85469.1 Ferric enterobactin transport protein [Photorhabdus asymbiotica]CAR67803.1 Ferric enterobactin transport protein [Photorhabdus asymbiotica subsp. asymbiotica ATCC 43949]
MINKPVKSTNFNEEYFNYYNSKQDDEIDLFELFSVLFQSKLLIIAVTIVFAVIGFVATSLMPQKWTSSASVIQPQLEEIQPLKNLLTTLEVLSLQPSVTSSSLYHNFLNNFNSRVLREEYLINTEYFKNLIAKSDDHSPLAKRKLIEKIVNDNISSSSKVEKDDQNNEEVKLVFSAETAEDAYNLLNGYINYASSVVRDQVKNELGDMVEQKLAYSEGLYQVDLNRVSNIQRANVERLKHALSIANSAGIKKPISSEGAMIKDDPDYSIALGSDALQRKLKITEEIKDPASIDADLRNRMFYINELKSLRINKVDFQPFRYMQAPYEPTAKDSPKRLIILIGSAFIGLILSVIFVMLRHMVRSRRQAA